jgi:ribosomal protein S18 acetylase RimI-like enzyme
MKNERPYTSNDYQFLREMLFEAVFWSRADDNRPSLEEGLSYDYTKHILTLFGDKTGDLAVIAEYNGQRAGAAFIRYWHKSNEVRGYVSDNIPVLVIGVAPAFRQKGVARGLLKTIKAAALDHGISKISLCVTKNNIAYHLYTKSNFEIVEDLGDSYNMLWKA